MRRRDGEPIWLAPGAPGVPLKRADLRSGTSAGYSESWLQGLLDAHPEVLPMQQIEPGHGRPCSVCRELPLNLGAGRSGSLDNFLVTDTGGLVLVETKLWRNPESRRTVVAQAMEYAAAVFRLDYEGLERAIARARRAQGKPDGTLFDIVSQAGASDLDEEGFIDAVARNLRRGRAVVAVVGDGIREDILPLAELLQSHAGHRFVFALVELGIFETPGAGGHLILPGVLAQTVLIERKVVKIDDRVGNLADQITVTPATDAPVRLTDQRPASLSEDEFFEIIERNHPGAAVLLRDFLAAATDRGIYPDVQGSMNLKHDAPEGRPFNLGSIHKDLTLNTGPASWTPSGAAERLVAAREYNERLAELIGGEVAFVQEGECKVKKDGKLPKLTDLLPGHADEWLAAIDAYLSRFLRSD